MICNHGVSTIVYIKGDELLYRATFIQLIGRRKKRLMKLVKFEYRGFLKIENSTKLFSRDKEKND